MPLKKSASNKAREQNIKTEIAHGKSPKEAVGEAYGIQKEEKKKQAESSSKKKK